MIFAATVSGKNVMTPSPFSILLLTSTLNLTAGFASWHILHSAANVKLVADKVIALGLDKLGYQYVNIGT